MRFTVALLTALTILKPTIDFIDSKDDSKVAYIIIDDNCKVKINKSELKDYDKLVRRVLAKCGY